MSRAKMLSLAQYVLACSASILWLAALGFSQSITVAPRSNPPTAYTTVSCSGFSAGADVDIYFDTSDLARQLPTTPALSPGSPFKCLPRRCRENTR